MKLLKSTLILLVVGSFLSSCVEKKYGDALTPEESLSTFQLDENFEVSLFASEPHVLDPVEMVIDENGSIYVVEMPDYPFQPEGAQGKGRIKKLLDKDGDGKIDGSIIFADGIKDATSLQCWKGGLLVTAAPYIYHLVDTTGDDVADVKEILFEGFFKENQEAQISNLRFNIDNWIYATNHGNAGMIKFNGDPTADPVDLSGTDFRFRLDRGLFEHATGTAQFGQTFNDWGHRFISHNTTHIRETVLPHRYLHRGVDLLDKKAALNISDHDLLMYQISDAPYWRVERSRRRQEVFDAKNLDRVEHVEGHFTGSSGGTHYGADLFSEDYQGNIFTGDVMGNLVHRDVLFLDAKHSAYRAERHSHDRTKEFLASTDQWFRPVNFCVGPDGALYVLDMYRQHIETPLSIPEDLKAEMDFLRGDDMGRIYRIVPKGTSSSIDLSAAIAHQNNIEQYLEWLKHPNQWFRQQAQRLLVEKQAQSLLPEIKKIFLENEQAVLRLHALYVLEGLNALSKDVVKQALRDDNARVREHGLILAEGYPECLPDMLALTSDADHRVVMQSALSLGGMQSEKVMPALAKILETHFADEWIRKAVLSSPLGSSSEMLTYLAYNTNMLENLQPEKESIAKAVGYNIGSRHEPTELIEFLQLMPKLPTACAVTSLDGMAAAIKKKKHTLSKSFRENLSALSENSTQDLSDAVNRILENS